MNMAVDYGCHVIKCNDMTERVCIGSRKSAEREMDALARSAWHHEYDHWEDELEKYKCSTPKYKTSYEYYRDRMYWHIDTVAFVMEPF